MELIWIGVLFKLNLIEGYVLVTLPEKTVTLLKREAAAIRDQSVVAVTRLRTFTGKLCWVAGVLPRVRWVVRIFYAVLAKHEREVKRRKQRGVKRRTPDHLVHTKRMALALVWIATFWGANQVLLTRTYHVYDLAKDLVIVTDASPWGVGAVLVHLATGKVMEALESPLIPSDEIELGVKIGDPAGQGIVELLAIWVALKKWIKYFAHRRRVPLLRADSMAALGAARKYASPTPSMNHLGGELGLMLEIHDVPEPDSAHLPGKLNDAADFLSRYHAPVIPPLPASLYGVTPKNLSRVGPAWKYLLPTATQRPDLWRGGDESSEEE